MSELDCDSRADTGHTVLHVAESFASGTASAIGDIVRNYPQAAHRLVYAFRNEANVDPRELAPFQSTHEMPVGHRARVRFLRRFLKDANDITHVHAHSSKAGAYVRTAARTSRARPILYTPHCYAFERLDIGWTTRQAFRAAEWLLSFNTSAYGACSTREAALSRWPVSSPPVIVLPNVMPPGLPQCRRSSPDGDLRIVGNGRIGPQKDPSFFADAFASAASTHPGLRGLWVGGGEASQVRRLEDSGVEVTGWLTRTEALAAMASCDVYFHTALWEGFPISIMEAAGMGLPVVARRRPYLSGVELPLVIDEPDQLGDTLRPLGAASQRQIIRDATRAALAANTDAHQHAALFNLYAPSDGACR